MRVVTRTGEVEEKEITVSTCTEVQLVANPIKPGGAVNVCGRWGRGLSAGQLHYGLTWVSYSTWGDWWKIRLGAVYWGTAWYLAWCDVCPRANNLHLTHLSRLHTVLAIGVARPQTQPFIINQVKIKSVIITREVLIVSYINGCRFTSKFWKRVK